MKKKVFALAISSILCSSVLFTGQAMISNNDSVKMQPSGRFRQRTQYNQYSGYQPSQIKHAYGVDKLSTTGQNQKIAIVVAYGSPTIQNDLASFNSKFSLTNANLQIYYPQGKPTVNDTGWAQETSLDVEWAHALAPNAAIDLVVAKSSSSNDLLGAVDYASNLGVQVVSMSWGGSEFSGETALDSHFQHSNTVYVAASGDNGAGTTWPAASPNVLAVGGTSLPLDYQGNLIGSETAWSGSGGGISRYEKEPSYQQKLNISSKGYRAIPDVAFNADPNTGVLVDYNSSWYIVGGTSFAAPAWAAFIALVDANRTTPLSNVQNQLYSIASTSQYSSDYRDITIGQNGRLSMDYAKKGYDFVTGLGTPLENNLLTNLAAN
ncbi:MAG: S53 family peptidase [Bacillota bacterium]|nr:S53 family peptidase [Bacillota bacterium]